MFHALLPPFHGLAFDPTGHRSGDPHGPLGDWMNG